MHRKPHAYEDNLRDASALAEKIRMRLYPAGTARLSSLLGKPQS